MAASILILLFLTVHTVFCNIPEAHGNLRSPARQAPSFCANVKHCVFTDVTRSCGHCDPSARSPGWCSEAEDYCTHHCGGVWCPQDLPRQSSSGGISAPVLDDSPGEAQIADMNKIAAAPLPGPPEGSSDGDAVEQNAEPHSMNELGGYPEPAEGPSFAHRTDDESDANLGKKFGESGHADEIMVSCLMGVSILGGFVIAWQDWRARELGQPAQYGQLGCLDDMLDGCIQHTQQHLGCPLSPDPTKVNDESRTWISIEKGAQLPGTPDNSDNLKTPDVVCTPGPPDIARTRALWSFRRFWTTRAASGKS